MLYRNLGHIYMELENISQSHAMVNYLDINWEYTNISTKQWMCNIKHNKKIIVYEGREKENGKWDKIYNDNN